MTVLALRQLREESSSMATTPTIPHEIGQPRPDDDSGPAHRGRIGWIVAGSLATGLVAALLLVAARFVPDEEPAITGAVLLGFALGWAMLACYRCD